MTIKKFLISLNLSIMAFLVIATIGLPQAVMAETDSEADSSPESPETEKTLAERFSWNVQLLSYGTFQSPSHSTQNPGNAFLQTPRWLGDVELRPDLNLDLAPLAPLELGVKPRMLLEYSSWTTERGGASKSGRDDDRFDNEWFVNEWHTRLKIHNNLFLSYGRENLQWGPSYLFSPSNPFFSDNGRRNPYIEVPGSDFARLVWIPASDWTISAIANTEAGRNKPIGPDSFKKTYAAKIDYTGRENYASTIVSYRDHAEYTLGFFGGWTASDAVLLYAEGAITKGSRALYPHTNGTSPFGISMRQIHKDDKSLTATLLLGASYTFESSGTLTLEYLYNGQGYSDNQAEAYYSLRQRAADAFTNGGMTLGLSRMTLGQTAATGLKFLRRNYVMLQYKQTNIMNTIDVTLRWTQNLDDGSFQVISLLSYLFGNHVELYSEATLNEGGKDTEFVGLLKYQCIVGVKYTF